MQVPLCGFCGRVKPDWRLCMESEAHTTIAVTSTHRYRRQSHETRNTTSLAALNPNYNVEKENDEPCCVRCRRQSTARGSSRTAERPRAQRSLLQTTPFRSASSPPFLDDLCYCTQMHIRMLSTRNQRISASHGQLTERIFSLSCYWTSRQLPRFGHRKAQRNRASPNAGRTDTSIFGVG